MSAFEPACLEKEGSGLHRQDESLTVLSLQSAVSLQSAQVLSTKWLSGWSDFFFTQHTEQESPSYCPPHTVMN